LLKCSTTSADSPFARSRVGVSPIRLTPATDCVAGSGVTGSSRAGQNAPAPHDGRAGQSCPGGRAPGGLSSRPRPSTSTSHPDVPRRFRRAHGCMVADWLGTLLASWSCGQGKRNCMAVSTWRAQCNGSGHQPQCGHLNQLGESWRVPLSLLEMARCPGRPIDRCWTSLPRAPPMGDMPTLVFLGTY
jgi:hypothetical protein